MGIIWSSDESSRFQQKLRIDIEAWDAGLADWEQQISQIQVLIGLGSGTVLSGKAWNAAKTLFVDRILPVVQTGRDACWWVGVHLGQYAGFEAPLLGDGTYLNENALVSSVDTLNRELNNITHTWGIPIYLPDPIREAAITALRRQIDALNDVINDLRVFSQSISWLFDTEIALSQTLSEAVRSISTGSLSADGAYVPSPGDNESWVSILKDYDNTHPYDPQSVFSNLPGQYGGNQGSLQWSWNSLSDNEKTQIIDIVHQYYSDMSSDDIQSLLSQMNETGCVYIADVNSLMIFFHDNTDGFQKKFGFPLYKPDGTMNFALLFADFWCYTQTHGGPPSISLTMNYWQDFLSEHGIKTTTTYKRPSSLMTTLS